MLFTINTQSYYYIYDGQDIYYALLNSSIKYQSYLNEFVLNKFIFLSINIEKHDIV